MSLGDLFFFSSSQGDESWTLTSERWTLQLCKSCSCRKLELILMGEEQQLWKSHEVLAGKLHQHRQILLFELEKLGRLCKFPLEPWDHQSQCLGTGGCEFSLSQSVRESHCSFVGRLCRLLFCSLGGFGQGSAFSDDAYSILKVGNVFKLNFSNITFQKG